ncbi:hypothetical protein EBT23_06445, partial [bacterium]|nr:hypothetical protein [bacterium]
AANATLQVDGKSGATTVQSNGTVVGSGTISGLAVNADGIVKITTLSTNSTGAWNTAGTINFATGSKIDVTGLSLSQQPYVLVRGSTVSGTPILQGATGFTVSNTGSMIGLTPTLDTDGDGLTDYQESQLGTNPNLTDTDGDGLNDGAEVNTYTTNPLLADTDGDGLSDSREVALGTNPKSVDTDGDGLNDNVETGTGTFVAAPGGTERPVTFTVVTNKITDGQAGTTSLVSTNGGSMSGKIMDGTVEAGEWFLSDFRFVRKATSASMTLAGANFASNGTTTTNPYGRAGVGVDMSNGGSEPAGIMKFSYGIQVSMKPGYRAAKIFLLGKNPAVNRSYGPQSNNVVGSIIASGFSGTGTVKNPSNNLVSSNGTIFTSGQSLSAYYTNPPTGQNSGFGDYSDSAIAWGLEVPGANPVGFAVDFTAGTKSAASEATAFSAQVFHEDTGTSPLSADSDGDGLSDSVETGTGIYVSATNAGTDPNKADTDGDGVSDGVEVNTLGTNPNLASSNPLPVISSQPGAITGKLGRVASMSVTASNFGPFTYQWRKEGINVSGATSSTLSFASLQPTDVGSYDVVVANTYGSATSSVANLTISTTRGFGGGTNAFTMDFVAIGNVGNAADTTGAPNPAGAVAYIYFLGKHEISRDMVIKANEAGNLGLTLGDLTSYGGNGTNRPATGISWYEAARFVNW